MIQSSSEFESAIDWMENAAHAPEGDLSTCQATIPNVRIHHRTDRRANVLFEDVMAYIKESLQAIDAKDDSNQTATVGNVNDSFKLTLIKTISTDDNKQSFAVKAVGEVIEELSKEKVSEIAGTKRTRMAMDDQKSIQIVD